LSTIAMSLKFYDILHAMIKSMVELELLLPVGQLPITMNG
jgi:hypothetical protein